MMRIGGIGNVSNDDIIACQAIKTFVGFRKVCGDSSRLVQ